MRSPHLLAALSLVSLVVSATLTGLPAEASTPPRPEPTDQLTDATPEVVVTGDLDGDRRSDLVLTTSTGSGSGSQVVVTARSGLTGKQLWRRPLVAGSSSVRVYPALLGSPARPGVVVSRTTAVVTSTQITTTLTVIGIDAAGRTVWTQRETGTDDGTTTTFPTLVGPATVGGHVGVLEVVKTASGTADPTTGDQPTSAQAVLVDGRDGTAHDVGAPFTTSGRVQVGTAPDVDGDGTADVAAISHEPGAATETLTVRSGATGTDLWTTTVKSVDPLNARIQAVGDVDGDGHPDLVTQGVEFDPAKMTFTSLPVTLLDGATGQVRWTDTTHTYAQPAGAKIRAVVLLGGKGPAMARRAGGSTLWTTSLPAGYIPLGQVTGDGSYSVLTKSNGGVFQVRSPANGKVLWQGADALNGGAVGAAVDGRGDDLLLFGAGQGVTVTARDGRDDSRIWTSPRLATKGAASFDVGRAGGDLTGDSCAEVLVTVGKQLVVLGGANGKPLWSLTTTSGKVTKGAKPARC